MQAKQCTKEQITEADRKLDELVQEAHFNYVTARAEYAALLKIQRGFRKDKGIK